MKRHWSFLAVLCVAAILATFAGCATTTQGPMITILSPTDGSTVPGSIPVTVQVANFNIVDKQGQANVAGEGHVHFYLDVGTVPSDPSKPAIPANANVQWAHVSGTSYTFTNVPPGQHTITVQLANNDHTPVYPLVYQTITVNVVAAAGAPTLTILSPQNGATLPAGSIPVTVQVANFNIVDKQGQANVAGEGHLHYYLDVGTVPSDPSKPAIPSNAQVQWAHVAATSYTFTSVAPGMHTITVQLANNDHTPVYPLVYQQVMITVAGQATTQPTTPPTTTMPSGGGNTVEVTLTAQNLAFDKSTITVPAGSHVVMTFQNMDTGVPHNFALYTDSHATQKFFVGAFVTGVKTVTYTFTAPATPGTYFFRCDVHPETMTGTFVTS